MKSCRQILSILALALLTILSSVDVSLTQPRVSARIGIQIQSNGGATRAKVRNRVKVGDRLRLYVVPAENAYIYLIRTDKKVAHMLNPEPYKAPAVTAMMLPNQGQFYDIDGSSKVESFTIICSPTELTDVQGLIGSANIPYQQWAAMEQKLIEKSRIVLTESVAKPFSIAGVVRNLSSAPKPLKNLPMSDQEFLKRLPIMSGNTLVVKTYDFAIKK